MGAIHREHAFDTRLAIAHVRHATRGSYTVALRDEQTILVASVPLDDEGWESLDEGAVIAMRNGTILRSCA